VPVAIRSRYGTTIDPRAKQATPFIGRDEEGSPEQVRRRLEPSFINPTERQALR